MPAQKYRLKLDMTDIPAADRESVKKDVADYVLEAVLSDIGEGRSPVYGTNWKGLSAAYKKEKEAEGSKGIANLELTGDLLDSLDAQPDGNYIVFGVFDKSQEKKADGHNNLSGDSKLPLRRFVPASGETFRAGIMSGINDILDEARVDPEEYD